MNNFINMLKNIMVNTGTKSKHVNHISHVVIPTETNIS